MSMKIDVIITAYKEPKTIGRAIEAFLKQKTKNMRIIAAAPDNETLDVIKKYEKKYKEVKHFKDPGKGKMLALNMIFKKVKGGVLILSDGDVHIDNNAVENILKHFDDKKVGCVTGHPVPEDSKETMFGYWGHLFTYMVHRSRLKRYRKGKYFTSTGYLFAFRNIIKDFDRDIPEDAIIPFTFMEKGYKIVYEEDAKVYVRYPTNMDEWLSQKTRIRKAYRNMDKVKKIPTGKSFFDEVGSFIIPFTYARSVKQFFWSLWAFPVRLYMWGLTFYQDVVKKQKHSDAWKRVESTK
jgi:cellulose synthase/poly-beta-1,6-N-acetylglucosamine synthase-like glycosyltransferase